MVKFETIPQAPLPTIMKSQITAHTSFGLDNYYDIKIVFVEVDLGRKYAKIFVTYQIVDGDFPYIYQDRFQVRMNDYRLKITNGSPLWNILRRLLIHDGFLTIYDDGAILITPVELKDYLTNRQFRIKGENIHSYHNAKAVPGGDSE